MINRILKGINFFLITFVQSTFKIGFLKKSYIRIYSICQMFLPEMAQCRFLSSWISFWGASVCKCAHGHKHSLIILVVQSENSGEQNPECLCTVLHAFGNLWEAL